MSYLIFTLNRGVTPGARVESFTLSGGGAIAAIIVGESGRGRSLGVLPVEGNADYVLHAADIGETRAGKPRLIPAILATDKSAAIFVCRTPIGFRGSNAHTGDRVNDSAFAGLPVARYLAGGAIAEGEAGRMGSGNQYVLLVPRGKVLRTACSGRLYGGAEAHYYVFDGTTVRVATWEERELSETDPMEVR